MRCLLFLFLGLFFCDLGYAQYPAYGKNRVQYDKFNWRYIQSNHFDVYYYDKKNYPLATFTIDALEAAYIQLKEDFSHELNNRIPVLVYDSHNDFSQTNAIPLPLFAEGIGGVTDKYKNRITIPFSGDFVNYRRVLHHELVHAVINDAYYGGSLQNIISRNIRLVFPLWFEEGLAEYLALGWDTNTDMFIREAVISDKLPHLKKLSGYYAYRGGQSFWFFVATTYGRYKITEVLQSFRLGRSIEGVFHNTFGKSIDEMSEQWHSFLKRRYFPEINKRDRLSEIGQKITRKKGSYVTSPAMSADGRQVAYITSNRGHFEVRLIDALTGKKNKTLINGQNNVDFEELNILEPNISWSPHGEKIALSAKSKGRDRIAIVDVRTKKKTFFDLPEHDAIGSVAWSPDGRFIAFDGNIGVYQDIFVLEISSGKWARLTHDIYSDEEPSWSPNSKKVFFVSNRQFVDGDTHLNSSIDLLRFPETFQKDIYVVEIESGNMERLTYSLEWSENQPKVTTNQDLIYISDKNGIPNLYKMNLKNENLQEQMITNVQSGILRYDIDRLGSRSVINALNETQLHLYTITSFGLRSIDEAETEANLWAKQRREVSLYKRVPALGVYLLSDSLKVASTSQYSTTDNNNKEKSKDEEVDFRNYVFSDDILRDSSLYKQSYLNRFNVSDSKLFDGRYQPKRYRVKLSSDISLFSGGISTGYSGGGGYGVISFSDILGDHNLSFILGSFNSNLRLGNYGIAYFFRKYRWNYGISFSHTSQSYYSISGETLQYRYVSLSLATSYPIDLFSRININLNGLYVSRSYSSRNLFVIETENRWLLYPSVSYTVDKTGFGFTSPYEGHRLFFSVYGSPPLSKGAFQFISVSTDLRQYIYLGQGSSIGLRFSGASSYGKDAQTFFLGGVSGWLNYRYDNSRLSLSDRLGNSFFAYPGFPLRGYGYRSINGTHYGLVNLELRVPIFQPASLSAIPSILPIYNLDLVVFMDVGTAWGRDFTLQYEYEIDETRRIFNYVNRAALDFSLRKENILFLDADGKITDEANSISSVQVYKGDIFASIGVGVRAIFLGLPFRYDVGWPLNGFKVDKMPTHHISLGIDF